MDLTNKLSIDELAKHQNSIKKIFFFRICGTGMGAAACLLREAGYDVSGCDYNFYPPMSAYLEKMNIETMPVEQATQEVLKDYDLIIVGNAVHRLSDQAKLIEESGVKFASFPAVLGALLLKERNVVGIAGTHGKTTTTFYLTQILEALGHKPGYLIGGVIDDRPSSFLGKDYFLIESDEYDSAYFEKFSKFQLYCINNLIVTSIEFDHADIYENIEQIQDQFRELYKKTDKVLIYNSTYPAAREIEKVYSGKAIFKYGANEEGPRLLSESAVGTEFELNCSGEVVTFKTNLLGLHNILNLSSCILFCLNEGVSIGKIKDVILNLRNVKRRQEIRGTYRGAIVIDDFAHHPRAIEMTLDGIKKQFPGKKIHAVVEPASATGRSDIFQKEFSECFTDADSVVIAKPKNPTSVTWAKQLDEKKLVADLSAKNINSTVAEDVEQLRSEIDKNVSNESILCIMSNGTCIGLWQSDFVGDINNV